MWLRLRRRFRPGWPPTLVALGAVAILCGLGTWQVQRHHWREADLAAKGARLALPPLSLAEVLEDPPAAAGRRARARGHYDHPQAIVVVRVPRDGREGARILTPLRTPEGVTVVVDRGWAPYSALSEILESGDPGGSVEVVGQVFSLAMEPVEPGSAQERRVEWVRFDPHRPGHPTALQAQLPYPLAPVLLQRQAEPGSGPWPRGGLSEPTSPVNHVHYAITWYGLASIALATWVGLGLWGGREERGPG